jgi:hypothetical protein
MALESKLWASKLFIDGQGIWAPDLEMTDVGEWLDRSFGLNDYSVGFPAIRVKRPQEPKLYENEKNIRSTLGMGTLTGWIEP